MILQLENALSANFDVKKCQIYVNIESPIHKNQKRKSIKKNEKNKFYFLYKAISSIYFYF